MKTIVKVVVGVLLVVTLYTAWQVVEDAQPKYGVLQILAQPMGADVFCDGIYEGTMGTTEYGGTTAYGVLVERPIGDTVTITVEKSGYHTFERRIRITRDPQCNGMRYPDFSDRKYYRQETIDITLQKKQFWE